MSVSSPRGVWDGNDDGAALGIPLSHFSEVGTFPLGKRKKPLQLSCNKVSFCKLEKSHQRKLRGKITGDKNISLSVVAVKALCLRMLH